MRNQASDHEEVSLTRIHTDEMKRASQSPCFSASLSVKFTLLVVWLMNNYVFKVSLVLKCLNQRGSCSSVSE